MARDPVSPQYDTTELDLAILTNLEARPRVVIPPDFAAQVAGQLPPRTPVQLRPRRFGSLAACACLALLLALMPTFAKSAAGGSIYALSAEMVLCLQFVLLTVWFVARSAGYTLPSRS